jgi:hypothetical protein
MRSGGSAWVARSTGGVTRAVRATTTAVTNSVSSGIEAVKERFGSAPPAAAPAPPAPVKAPDARPVRPRPLLRASAGWVPAVAGAAYVAPAATAGSGESLAELLGELVETPAAAAPIVEPGEWAVYSAEDADVVPPMAVHPKLPTEPPPGVRIEELPVIELLISATGEVERARLRTMRPDVRASMMVSAAKAWRFDPATRGGTPVRYRLNVPLISY